MLFGSQARKDGLGCLTDGGEGLNPVPGRLLICLDDHCYEALMDILYCICTYG